MAQFHGYLHLAQQRQRDERRWAVMVSLAGNGGELAQKLLKGLGDDR